MEPLSGCSWFCTGQRPVLGRVLSTLVRALQADETVPVLALQTKDILAPSIMHHQIATLGTGAEHRAALYFAQGIHDLIAGQQHGHKLAGLIGAAGDFGARVQALLT